MKTDKLAAANIAKAVLPLVNDITLRRVTLFMDGGSTIKATRQRRNTRRDRTETILLTYGEPNYAEREALKRAKKKKVVLHTLVQVWPKKVKK